MLCYPKKICGQCDECFPLSFANYARAVNWSVNNSLTPRQVSANSHKLYKFLCDVCDHEFEICPRDVIRGSFCSFCAIPSRRVCANANCQFCFERSFASFEYSVNWSEANDKSPREILKSTHDKYLFECATCLHEFEASPNNITQGKACPYCASRALCNDSDCEFCYKKSFASSPKACDWIDTRTTPRQVMLNCNRKYKFRCSDCDHEYTAALNQLNEDRRCVFCCWPGRALCDDDNCQHCFSRSFASHPRAIDWSPKNSKRPREVFLNSNTKYIFLCPDCNNEIIKICGDVAGGSFCGLCRNKTEKKLMAWLQTTFPDLTVTYQVRFKWCFREHSRNKMPFDFVIEDLKLVIELNGAQHYAQVRNYQSPEIQAERDAHKMKLAMEHGYTVVAVLQEPVWADKQDWQNKVAACIKKHDMPTAYTIRMGLPSARRGFLGPIPDGTQDTGGKRYPRTSQKKIRFGFFFVRSFDRSDRSIRSFSPSQAILLKNSKRIERIDPNGHSVKSGHFCRA